MISMIFVLSSIAYAQQDKNISSNTQHFNSKQKEEISGGACVIQTDAFPVGFNAYVVPEGNHPSYPPFCSPVPTGPLNIVLDILDPNMRKVPLTLKLLKLEDGRELEISSLPEDLYPFGSISFAADLEPVTSYKILILFEDNFSELENNRVEIPFEVRRKGDFVHTGTGGSTWGFFFFVLGILGLGGWIIRRILQSQNTERIKDFN
ncbi:MAG: hypothetical protein H0V39_04815 [Nitrosomonas sp.]|nr:hypothetical protein [Nitrosomonas sp.]